MGRGSKESRCLRHPYFTFKDHLFRFRIIRFADDPELGATQKNPAAASQPGLFYF